MRVAAVTMTLVGGTLPKASPVGAQLGDYLLLAHLGRGGMAQLYVARDERNGRLVALKQATPGGDDRDARLVDEARLSATVRHPAVVRTRRIVRPKHGAPYLVMEYVEGLDLRQLLGSCARRKLSPPVEIRLAIIRAVLEALEAVHHARGKNGARVGLIHRDISASNVLLGFDGCIKLCDFGIALAAGSRTVNPERIEGKAAYMSPEQARGEPIDRRVDIYGVGVLAWELLAGRRMRSAPDRDRLLEVAAAGRVPPMPVRGLPDEAELLGIVHTALSLDPRRRYCTASAMLGALDAYTEKHGLCADGAQLAAWLNEHFAQERALRPRAVIDADVEEPTASRVRRVRRTATEHSGRSMAGLAVRALAVGSALVWLLHGLGAW